MLRKLNELKRINSILPELIIEMLVYGVFMQVTVIWFVKEKLFYSVGLWIGVMAAIAMAIHMSVVILDSLDAVTEKKARINTTVHALVRYIVILIIFFILYYFRIGNILAVFLGTMGLKAAAYFHPFAHKFRKRQKERGDKSTDNT